jgi:hypothetical protein
MTIVLDSLRDLVARLLGRTPGPRVRYFGMGQVTYADGGRRMTISGERLRGGAFAWVVYTDTIERWEPPFAHEPVTPETKARIVEAIRAEFARNGETVAFEERPRIEPWAPEGASIEIIAGRPTVRIPDPPSKDGE